MCLEEAIVKVQSQFWPVVWETTLAHVKAVKWEIPNLQISKMFTIFWVQTFKCWVFYDINCWRACW